MDRRGFIGGLTALTAGAFVFYVQPTEQQVTDLEKEVDALDGRLTALETRVAELGTGSQPTPDADASAQGEGQTVSGLGTTVSDMFPLQQGRYRVNATLELTSSFSGLIAFIHGPSGASELLFNELIDNAGPWQGSSLFQATETGEHFVSVENTTDSWTFVFEPF